VPADRREAAAAYCQVCIDAGVPVEEARFPLDEILGHVRAAHEQYVDLEPATWPDGGPVVVDTTVAPEDFGV
jgi:hypothetical protein